MIKLESALEGKQFNLYELEQKLKPIGYSIGGNWDYDHGSFDYKMDDEVGYQFLRLPFSAIDGQLDTPGVMVQFDCPFLLAHKYQIGLDDNASTGSFSGSFNQFSEPQDPDASFPEEYIAVGKRLLKQAEKILMAE
ncbi:hypothetical protein JOC78_001420 [Bacillus ectoiniformans]|uniref:YugN-like family protein n=1 Tax=Bacillus ectoiniformans TaxID=1494429 RepID=UPI00195C7143|nr:YugN-like family protein [Bacillus ectoiniformans]MBM7648474.1 hypothetical protein [Bacillus ectoiniformans]